MISILILINYSLLLGIMFFFVAGVSPSAISTLNGDNLSSFLRTIFPKLFVLGLIFGISGNCLTFNSQLWISIPSVFISASFIVNLLIVTPKINGIMDDEKLNENTRKRSFIIYHGVSVLLFSVNFVLAFLIIFTESGLSNSVLSKFA